METKTQNAVGMSFAIYAKYRLVRLSESGSDFRRGNHASPLDPCCSALGQPGEPPRTVFILVVPHQRLSCVASPSVAHRYKTASCWIGLRLGLVCLSPSKAMDRLSGAKIKSLRLFPPFPFWNVTCSLTEGYSTLGGFSGPSGCPRMFRSACNASSESKRKVWIVLEYLQTLFCLRQRSRLSSLLGP